MNKDTYQAMIKGLVATIVEKEVVMGEADARADVLKILDLLEDLDMFWNSDWQRDDNAEKLYNFIDETRKKYKLGRENANG